MHYLGFWKIIRPVNCIVAGIAGLVAYFIATGSIIPSAGIIFLIVFLITAAGNVINDYFDAAIDAINRPERPIPAGMITRKEALWYAVILAGCGNLIGIFLAPLPLILIALINTALLWVYAADLKRRPFLGNLSVSYLSASMFLFGGAYAGMEGFMLNIPIAGATFFAMLSRELIKDVEDIPGDQADGATTLPLIIGIKKTEISAIIFAVLGVSISLLLYLRWGPVYCLGIIPVDAVILLGAARAGTCTTPEEVQRSKSTTLLKAGMFASLIIFLLSAALL